LVGIDNEFGAKTNIHYRSIKGDTGPMHQVPFAEIVVDSVDTSNTNGSRLGATLYAYGGAELFFDAVRVPREYLLGEENQGFMYLMQNFQTERLVAAVGATAGSRLLLDDAVAYGKERTAFGKPIIRREVWQHRFVDLYTKVEMSQAFAYKCVDRYNEERYVQKVPLSIETVKLISMAKIAASELASEVADACLQFHGGWGYIEDFHVARAFRDQRLLRIGAGSTEVLRYYIAKLMGF